MLTPDLASGIPNRDRPALNVSIIGGGLQGKRHAASIQGIEGCRVATVCDVNMKVGSALAARCNAEATSSWEDAIGRPEVDAVVVCTPPHLHAPITIAALSQGKHVLCEKPLGRSPEEAKAMVQVASEAGLKLKCGCNLRHHPGIAQAKQWLVEGRIGDPLFLRCRYGICGRPDYDKEWRGKPEISGGGELMDQGFHVLDLCRWFLGDFAEVFAYLSTAFWQIAPVEDNAFVLLRTPTDQVASLHVSWTQWKNLFSLEIFGRDGYVQVEGLGGSYGTERAILGRREFLEPFPEEVIEFRGEDLSWREEWKEFLAAIQESREPQGNGHDGLAVHDLVRAAYQSARTGRAERLQEG
jgi:predicted dehydrogenase